MYFPHRFLTQQHVDAVNAINEVARQIAPELPSAFADFVGQKILKADGQPTKAFRSFIDDFVLKHDQPNGVRVSWRCGHGAVWIYVEKSYCFTDGTRQRVSHQLLVNGVKDRHMEEMSSRSSGEYSYMLTHKLEDVLTLVRRVEELGKEMSTIKRYLNQFT